jgi:hypothetical protein
MHNSFLEASQTPMSERVSKFFSLESKLRNGIQNSFSLNSKIPDLSFKSNSKFYFEKIPNLSSNLFDLNPWINVQISIFESPKFYSNFKFPFESIQGSIAKNFKNILTVPILLLAQTTSSPLSYPIFMPKPSTHRMHDPGSIVPQIWPKVFTDNQMSWIKYNYYISNVSKDYDDSQQNRTVEDSITP